MNTPEQTPLSPETRQGRGVAEPEYEPGTVNSAMMIINGMPGTGRPMFKAEQSPASRVVDKLMLRGMPRAMRSLFVCRLRLPGWEYYVNQLFWGPE